jgi:hypothetical protein
MLTRGSRTRIPHFFFKFYKKKKLGPEWRQNWAWKARKKKVGLNVTGLNDWAWMSYTRLIPGLFVNGLFTFFNGIQWFKDELNKKLEEVSKKTIHSISETQESSNWRYKYVLVKTTSFDLIFCCRPAYVNKCWRRQRPKWRIFVISCRLRMKTIEILTQRLAKQNTY